MSTTTYKQNNQSWGAIAGIAAIILVWAASGDWETDAVWQNSSQGNLAQQYMQNGQIPPPVDLPIQNISQETNVWCWAAVSQQIIMATRGQQGTPPQCALVGIANGQPAQSCCNNPAPCIKTGSLEQIQALIQQFGGRSSSIVAPTDPMNLYQTLANGHAVVLAVRTSPYMGHVIVLRGMAWQQGPQGLEPVLFINDPMAYYTQPIPFRNIAKIWDAAIVIS